MNQEFKISFYVPPSHLEKVKTAMFEAGAGKIGNYEACAWQTLGQGQYRPLTGSQPYYGQLGEIEHVEEYWVEMTCNEACLKATIEALIKAHPYETPVYGIIRFETLTNLCL